jgi:hypothetical protein
MQQQNQHQLLPATTIKITYICSTAWLSLSTAAALACKMHQPKQTPKTKHEFFQSHDLKEQPAAVAFIQEL